MQAEGPVLTGVARALAGVAAKGRPLTAVERKHVKYDPKRAPPKAVGALNMPKATAPPGAHWP